MAVADLQNLSAFGPFFGESQSQEYEPDTPRIRASSLLQMWREIEGDHVVNHSPRLRRQRNGTGSESLSTSSSIGQRSDNSISGDVHETDNRVTTGLMMDHDDNNSIVSENDLGEIERERVRQSFREWTNSGATDNGNNHSGPHLLDENECERVRIIREWAQMNSQQGNNQELVRDLGSDTGSQIERVYDGLAQIERRPIRKLCGRQTLLDLLHRAECERKEELHRLLEQRPVSDFTHRNRIQAFLRGRFLRNERVVSNERPSSVAASELGFLRQRHTVSGLREGFLSKLGNSASTAVICAESGASFGEQNNGEPNLVIAADGNMSQQEFGDDTEIGDPTLVNMGNERELCLDYSGQDQEVSHHDGVNQEVSLDGGGVLSMKQNLVVEATEQMIATSDSAGDTDEVTEQEVSVADLGSYRNEPDQRDVSSRLNEFHEGIELEMSCHQVINQEVSLVGRSAHSMEQHLDDVATDHVILNSDSAVDRDEVTERELSVAEASGIGHGEAIINDFPLEIEDINQSRPHDVFHGRYESSSLSSVLEGTPSNLDLESEADEAYQEDGSSQQNEFHESVTDTQERSWQQLTSVVNSESNTNVLEQDQIRASHEDWPSHDLQEAIDSWLDMPSGISVERRDTNYLSDDDNVQSMELQELFSRRRVSGLLRSGFRESLDQVLQSHVERLGQTSGDWEIENVSLSPSLAEQHHVQENSGDLAAVPNLFTPFDPSTFVDASQPLWDEEMQAANMQHNLIQHLGTEWEVVNELRIEMVRLQQRLNNMQSILEQCMDMQIELQRSIRQEVSAALNRSISSRDASKGVSIYDESQLDYVRKGICCLCHNSNIDSLLYRCGHMCTCSKCAENLIQGTGKCPMCRAPVAEAVRAYFIH